MDNCLLAIDGFQYHNLFNLVKGPSRSYSIAVLRVFLNWLVLGAIAYVICQNMWISLFQGYNLVLQH